MEADGSLTVGGLLPGDGSSDAFVSRIGPDGLLDDLFGDGGVVLVASAGAGEYVSFSTARLDGQGRVLAAGLSGSERRVTRYLADGLPDPSFGQDGIAVVGFDRADQFNPKGLWPLEDGGFFLGGDIGGPTGGLVVARYDASGALDEGFGDGGRIIVSRSTNTEQFTGFAGRAGGVYVLGETFQTGNQQGRVVAVGPDGLDASFADGGVLQTDALVRDAVVGAVEQPDGRLVTLSRSYGTTPSYSAAVLDRYADGRLDPSFAPDGTGRLYETFGRENVRAVSLAEQRGEGLLVTAFAGSRIIARYDAPVRVRAEDANPAIALASSLSVWPNPTAGAASVRLEVPSASPVRVSVVDVLGREVAVLHDGRTSGAETWRTPSTLAPGVYTVLAEGARERVACRFTVIR